MPADEDVANYLEDQTFGTVGTDIFYSRFPNEPDDCVCVFQSSGRPPMPWLSLESPGISIIVRGTDPDTTRIKANEIFKALAGLIHQTWDGVKYHSFESMGSPSNVIEPQTNRSLWSFSFIVLKDME